MQKPTLCKSCKAEIYFLLTAKGKRMPVDQSSYQDAMNVIGDDKDSLGKFDPKKHISHFSTCPAAASHRKSDKPKKLVS